MSAIVQGPAYSPWRSYLLEARCECLRMLRDPGFCIPVLGFPLMFYLLPLKLNRMTFTSTTVFFFGIVNLIKLPFFAVLGLLTADNLAVSAALAPVALIGVAIGTWLLKVMNEQLFYRLSYLLTFAAGLKLMWDGLPLS